MTDSESGKGGVFDSEKILRIVELMKEHDLAEVDLRGGEQQIRIRRGGPAGGGPAGLPAGYAMPAASPASPSASQPAAAEPDAEHIVLIKAPMVGTFYVKPNPKAQPYVKVGDHIEPETTVCIIEAMKVFNEIPAEVSGRVLAVLADNEEPVEFGKPLFKIDTRG